MPPTGWIDCNDWPCARRFSTAQRPAQDQTRHSEGASGIFAAFLVSLCLGGSIARDTFSQKNTGQSPTAVRSLQILPSRLSSNDY